MPPIVPVAGFEARVRSSFDRQRVMTTIGASLVRVAAGEVDIRLPFRGDLTQQHEFLHAGVVATIADSACGYAAYTLMPADASVLTIEFKINLLAPARGTEFVARGRVLRPGRTVTVCQAEVFSAWEGRVVQVATMTATLMTMQGRSDVVEAQSPTQ